MDQFSIHQAVDNNGIKSAAHKFGRIIILRSCFLIFLIAISSFIETKATTNLSPNQFPDSVSKLSTDSISSFAGINNSYLQFAELEHQKLLRNIFAAGFFLTLILLIFNMFFYGNKIKKVTGIILLQDEALKSTKDQLIKVINIFNHLDHQVYITDNNGNIEWMNSQAMNYFKEDYIEKKIKLTTRFKPENQQIIANGIQEQQRVDYKDDLFPKDLWKMIPLKNSKGEFSNMVFIC
jgi:transcriptional regulator with PAS, ATPase and Fis domain